jgi:GT2 family glycosyltransferase
MSGQHPSDTAHSRVSVIVPVHNGGDDLRRCLEAIAASNRPPFECILVDDASTDGQAEALSQRHGARLLRQSRQRGPAAARNAGAVAASGDLLMFVDADVLLHADAIDRAVHAFENDAELGAVFGSYDERPADPGLLSRYRNLYHHWNHQIGNEVASTFWTGCGAVRRDLFRSLGGFSEAFARPSIEDIEFGYRLRAAGHPIRLLKDMRCTHLKRWTLGNMVHTDIFLRGKPWVELLQRFEDAPNDLNLGWQARVATGCTGLLLLSLAVLAWFRPAAVLPFFAFLAATLVAAWLARDPEPADRGRRSVLVGVLALMLPLASAVAVPDAWALLPLALAGAVVLLQLDFYRLLARLHGLAFALAAIPLQLLFFLNCGVAVPLGLGSHLLGRGRGD